MEFTFKVLSGGDTASWGEESFGLEISFEAIDLEDVLENFKRFLMGAGFPIAEGEELAIIEDAEDDDIFGDVDLDEEEEDESVAIIRLKVMEDNEE